MRLLICGDRHWTNSKLIGEWIDKYSPDIVIEGDCRGADKMAGEEARKRGIGVEEYPAQWDKHGRGAGPIRNKQMLEEGKPTHVLAFHNNIEESKGTKNMLMQAERIGIQVEVITE